MKPSSPAQIMMSYGTGVAPADWRNCSSAKESPMASPAISPALEMAAMTICMVMPISAP